MFREPVWPHDFLIVRQLSRLVVKRNILTQGILIRLMNADAIYIWQMGNRGP